MRKRKRKRRRQRLNGRKQERHVGGHSRPNNERTLGCTKARPAIYKTPRRLEINFIKLSREWQGIAWHGKKCQGMDRQRREG